MVAEFKELAEANDTMVSAIIREAVERYILENNCANPLADMY